MRVSHLPLAALVLSVMSTAATADTLPIWNGVYAGMNVGYGFGNPDASTTGQTAINNATIADGARRASVEMDNDGLLTGIQLGFNWQADALVFGLETDIQYADIGSVRNFVTTGTAFPGTRNNIYSQELEYFGTVRGRLGFLMDSSLLYATGGMAYGGVNNSVAFSGPAPTSANQFSGRNYNNQAGYTVGGGFEHAMDENWSIKAEYLYYDLGKTIVAANVVPGSGGAGTGYNVNFENTGHIVRLGVNFGL